MDFLGHALGISIYFTTLRISTPQLTYWCSSFSTNINFRDFRIARCNTFTNDLFRIPRTCNKCINKRKMKNTYLNSWFADCFEWNPFKHNIYTLVKVINNVFVSQTDDRCREGGQYWSLITFYHSVISVIIHDHGRLWYQGHGATWIYEPLSNY